VKIFANGASNPKAIRKVVLNFKRKTRQSSIPNAPTVVPIGLPATGTTSFSAQNGLETVCRKTRHNLTPGPWGVSGYQCLCVGT
jgi:hypothetical protein